VDLAEPPTLVGIKPKPQFLEILGRVGPEEMATDKIGNEGSDAENASEPILTGWWRRGRVGCSLFETDIGRPLAWEVLISVGSWTGRGGRVELYRTPYLRNPVSATGVVGVELLAA